MDVLNVDANSSSDLVETSENFANNEIKSDEAVEGLDSPGDAHLESDNSNSNIETLEGNPPDSSLQGGDNVYGEANLCYHKGSLDMPPLTTASFLQNDIDSKELDPDLSASREAALPISLPDIHVDEAECGANEDMVSPEYKLHADCYNNETEDSTADGINDEIHVVDDHCIQQEESPLVDTVNLDHCDTPVRLSHHNSPHTVNEGVNDDLLMETELHKLVEDTSDNQHKHKEHEEDMDKATFAESFLPTPCNNSSKEIHVDKETTSDFLVTAAHPSSNEDMNFDDDDGILSDVMKFPIDFSFAADPGTGPSRNAFSNTGYESSSSDESDMEMEELSHVPVGMTQSDINTSAHNNNLSPHPNHKPLKSQIEKEFQINDEGNLWADAYRRLRNTSSVLTLNSTVNAARAVENRNRNRYRDVSPYDHSRVALQNCSNDYINASLVLAPHAQRRFLMTQGPLASTSGHFWLMVLQQKCSGIVMLNRIIEKGTLKCHPYFPDDRSKTLEFPEEKITVSLKKTDNFGYYLVRTLSISSPSCTREILHFHYLTWPDFGVPQTPAAFLNFLLAVRRAGLLSDPDRPPVIHCSAGIGRTGSLAVIDVCLVLALQKRSLYGIDILEEVRQLRKYRMGLIQTPDQLRFCYEAVIMGGSALVEAGNDDNLSFEVEPAEAGFAVSQKQQFAYVFRKFFSSIIRRRGYI